jgi:hypothetical protein
MVNLTAFGILVLAPESEWHRIFNNILNIKLQQASLQKNEGILKS